ncbi:MAG: hypothetical protein ACI88A_005216 [Paraglaciecola sp.]|jgi:hypothetical protein
MSNTLDKILQSLQAIEHMNLLITEQGLTDAIRKLQTWQTNRLLVTHDDLWNSERFKPAMQFFVDELYGPRDFSQRDIEMARAVPTMTKIIPNKGLISLQTALRLNCLSLELDIALAQKLGNEEVNRSRYFDCYRHSSNQSQREEQIQLLENLSIDLPKVVRIPGISVILMLSRKPAKVAGVESLHAFLEKGFNAFKELGNVHDFIDPIISRERDMMNALFAANGPTENPLPDEPLPKY